MMPEVLVNLLTGFVEDLVAREQIEELFHKEIAARDIIINELTERVDGLQEILEIVGGMKK